MTIRLTEPATDWTGQIYEERLRLCAETLFIHGLINDSSYNHTTARIRADLQRERTEGIA
jgi:hypothetical protein